MDLEDVLFHLRTSMILFALMFSIVYNLCHFVNVLYSYLYGDLSSYSNWKLLLTFSLFLIFLVQSGLFLSGSRVIDSKNFSKITTWTVLNLIVSTLLVLLAGLNQFYGKIHITLSIAVYSAGFISFFWSFRLLFSIIPTLKAPHVANSL
ncbi:hypothetical protein RCL1_000468 [Eukaryota sp. TZLM3-RCL]